MAKKTQRGDVRAGWVALLTWALVATVLRRLRRAFQLEFGKNTREMFTEACKRVAHGVVSGAETKAAKPTFCRKLVPLIENLLHPKASKTSERRGRLPP